MYQTLRLFGGIFLAALPASLSAQKVTVEFDQAMEFGSLKTFTLRTGQVHSKNPSLNDIVRKNRETVIRKKFTEKGLTEATRQPDLTVSWALGSARPNRVGTLPRLMANPACGRPLHRRHTDDRPARSAAPRTVWRFKDDREPGKIQARLDAMAKKSFDKYPPKKKRLA